MIPSASAVLLLLAASLSAQDSALPAGWTATGALAEARANSCAVRLADSRVLVAGGMGAPGDLSSAEIYSNDGTFSPAASMNTSRSNQSCTLLADGRVLAAGGSADGSAELYDPAADAWQVVPGPGEIRFGQAAVRLADGRVLLAGGVSAGYASATLEIFDPQTNTLTRNAAGLVLARQDLAAALLADGTVLLIGGRNESGPLGSVELFDPSNGLVGTAAALSTPRNGHSATVLDDGRVLVAGGSDGVRELDSAEIYDPAVSLWTPQSSRLHTARRDAVALLIPGNGGVLIAGGQSAGQALAATEVYLPVEGVFVGLGPLTLARTGIAAAAFDDGAILAAGGLAAGVPRAACGVLGVPALRFNAATIHPQETSQATGSNFTNGTTVNFTLDLQGAIAGSTIASAQSRLLTTSIAIPQTTSFRLSAAFGPVSVFAAQLADAGQTFRLTARSSNSLTATITVPVKVKITMTAPALNPAFEGLNATFLVQLVRAGNPGPMGGTVTANLGGDVRTAVVNTANSSQFLSFAKNSVPAGTLALSYTYSGDAMHEAASATAAFTAVSRTPLVSSQAGFSSPAPDGSVRVVGNSAIVGTPVTLSASVHVAGPLASAPPPSGTVTFLDRGVALGSAVLTPVTGQPGAATASLQFTPLTTASISLSASYAGDSTYRAASSASGAIQVQHAVPTLLATPPPTFTCGSPTSIEADLIFPPTLGLINRTVGVFTSSSTLSLSSNPQAQGTLVLSALSAGRAVAIITGTLPKDTTSISAQFDGDALLAPVRTASSRIAVLPVPVNVQIASTAAGGGVTLTATVAPAQSCGGPAPTGTISFAEGGTVLAALPISASQAGTGFPDGTSNTITLPAPNSVSVTLARPPGPHTFTARYTGDSLHQAGVSSPVTVTFQ